MDRLFAKYSSGGGKKKAAESHVMANLLSAYQLDSWRLALLKKEISQHPDLGTGG
jgi:hypothetical protein